MRKRYLVCYDISSDKLRRRSAKLLLSMGERIELSVYLIQGREAKINKLLRFFQRWLDHDTDSVMILPLCRHSENNTSTCGAATMPDFPTYFHVS